MTVRTKKLTFSLFLLLVSLGCNALASKSYFGVATDGAFVIQGEKVVQQVAIVSSGVQLGVKSLLGPFELRATTEHSVYKSVGLYEGALDLTFDLGGAIDMVGVAMLGGGGVGIG